MTRKNSTPKTSKEKPQTRENFKAPPSDDQFKYIIYLAVAAIFAILTIVLLVLTPFIPDEAVTGIITLIAGFFGVREFKARGKE